MNSKKGDMLMLDINSNDAELLRLMNYTPYTFDNNKRVIYLVDKKGLKLYKKLKKHIRGNNNEV